MEHYENSKHLWATHDVVDAQAPGDPHPHPSLPRAPPAANTAANTAASLMSNVCCTETETEAETEAEAEAKAEHSVCVIAERHSSLRMRVGVVTVSDRASAVQFYFLCFEYMTSPRVVFVLINTKPMSLFLNRA